MAKNTNISPKLLKTAKRQQHFSIRKLTIGATSVLLGTTLWLGSHANVVRADTQNNNGDASPHEATESNEDTPQITANTKVEVEQAQASQNSQKAVDASKQSQPQIVSEQNNASPKTNIANNENNAKEQNVQTDTRQNGDQTNNQNDTANNVNNDRNSAGSNAIAETVSKRVFKSNQSQVSAKQTVARKSAVQDKSEQNLNISALGNAGVKNVQKQDSSASLSLLLKDNKLENKLLSAQDKSAQSIKQVSDWNQLVSAANDQNINDIQITQNIDAAANLQLNRSTALTIESAPSTVSVGGTTPATKYTLNLGGNAIDLPNSGTASVTLKNLTITGTNNKAAVQSSNGSASAHFENVDVHGTPLFNGKGNVYIDGQVSSNVSGIAHSTTPDLNDQFHSFYKAGINTANWYNANILADNVFIDPNAHLTISRDLTGDGIAVEGGLADGTGQKKYGSVTLGDQARLNITLKNGHDLAASTEENSDIDNANTAIYAPQNGQFKTGANAVVNIYAGHGRGIIFDEPAGGTSTVQEPTMDDWARIRTTTSNENNAQNDFELGNHTSFNVHSRDGVLLGNHATLNTGQYSKLDFDNHGNGIGLQLDADANVEVGPYTDFELTSDGKNNSGDDHAGNYIGLGDNAQFTVDHDATFRYKLTNTNGAFSDQYYTDAFNVLGFSRNPKPTINIEQNAVFDGESDLKNYMGEILSFGTGAGTPTLNINNARYFNLQRDAATNDGRGNLFYSFNPCTINVTGDSDNIYKWSNGVISQDNFDSSTAQKLQQSIQDLNNSSSEYWTDVKSISINNSKGISNPGGTSTDSSVGKKHQWALNDTKGNGFDFANSQRLAIVGTKAQTGTVNIIFHDTTTNTDITGYGPKTPLTGDEGTAVTGYNLNTDIETLENEGYVRDTASTIPTGDLSSMPAKYTDGSQTVYINLKHGLEDVNKNNPHGFDVDRNVSRQVKYTINGLTTDSLTNHIQSAEFERIGHWDKVDHKLVDVINGQVQVENGKTVDGHLSDWKVASGSNSDFTGFAKPTLAGYHVDGVIADPTSALDANAVVSGDNEGQVKEVTATADYGNVTVTIDLTKDAPEKANLKIVDDTTGKTLNDGISAEGDENKPISFASGESTVQGYLNNHYRFVSVVNDADPSTPLSTTSYADGAAKFGNYDTDPNKDQGFTVHLVHQIDRIDKDHPHNQNVTATVTRQVNYTVDGLPDSSLPSQSESANFSATGYYDEVTNKVVDLVDGTTIEQGKAKVDQNGNETDGHLTWTVDGGTEDSSTLAGYAAPTKAGYHVNSVTTTPVADKDANVDDIGLVKDLTVDHNGHDVVIFINLTNNAPQADVQDIVNYIDDTTGQTLKTDNGATLDTLKGRPNDKVNYTTAGIITSYTDQGYRLVSNDFHDGQEDFGNSAKVYNVHLAHRVVDVDKNNPRDYAVTATVTRQVNYTVDGVADSTLPSHTETANFSATGYYDLVEHQLVDMINGQEKVINGKVDDGHLTWTVDGGSQDSSILAGYAVPTKQGYYVNNVTVDPATDKAINADSTGLVHDLKVNHNSGNVTVTINLTKDQMAQVIYRDVDNPQHHITIGTDTNLTGKAGEIIKDDHIPIRAVHFEMAGYVLVKNGLNDAVFDNVHDNIQTFYVDFKHGTVTISPNNPGKPGQPINPHDPNGPKWGEDTDANHLQVHGSQTIHYTGAGSSTPADNVQTIVFDHNELIDKVTGKFVADYGWTPGSYTFNNVNTPVINGYHADQTAAGGATVMPDNPNVTINVTYTKNASPVPVIQNAQISVIDEDNNNSELTSDNASGNAGTAISFGNMSQTVQNYLDNGYKWDYADEGTTKLPATNYAGITFGNFDNNDSTTQNWTIYLKHKISSVDAAHPGNGYTSDQLQHTVTTDVSYVDQNGNAIAGITPIHETVTFNGQGDYDQVTHKWVTVDQNGNITGQAQGPNWAYSINGGTAQTGNQATLPAIAAQTPAGYHFTRVTGNADTGLVINSSDGSFGIQTVTRRSKNSNLVVHYAKETGSVTVTFRDDDLGLNIQNVGYNSGSQDVGTQIFYNPNTDQNNLENEGYVYVKTDGTLPAAVAEGNTAIVIHMRHDHHDVSATDPQAEKTIKRTIIVTNPDGSRKDLSQTLQLHRSAIQDAVTKQVTYGDWNEGRFAAVTIPTIAGYNASQNTIPAVAQVTADFTDPHIQVSYTSTTGNQGTEVINYIDSTGKQVGNQVLHGRIGSTSNFALKVPDGYDVGPNQSIQNNSIQVRFEDQTPVTNNISVTDHLVRIDPDKLSMAEPILGIVKHKDTATLLPGTKGKYAHDDLTYGDLHEERSRGIIIINPDGSLNKSSIAQTVAFKRWATIDAVTGEVTFDAWQPVGQDSFDEVAVPTIAGYTPTQTTVAAMENVPSDYTGKPIVVRYNGDPTTQTIAYRDQNGQLISTQTINGRVGEDLALKPVVPDGYQLVPSEQIPKQVKLGQNNKAIDVMLQPVTVNVDPDEVTVNKPISSKTVISGTTSKHLAHDITYQDLHKDVTRTVTIKQPDGTIDPHSCTQTVHFTRTATINGVTGSVTYGKWVPESTDSLAPVVVPPVTGYTANTQVPAVSTVTNDYKDPQIVVTYTPNEQKQTVIYQDEQGHVLGQQVITGKTDQTVKINPQAPDGYTVDSNSQAPTQVKMAANSQPITITVTPKQTVIKASDVTPTKSISTSDVLPGTVNKHPDRNVTYQDLNKDVQRQVIVNLPNGQQRSIVQTVHFERQANIDSTTGKVTFGNWTSQGSDNFAKVNLPTINGYIPTNVASEVDGISDTDDSQTVKINYLPDTPANRLQIAKNSLKDLQQAQDDSAKKLSALQNVAARAGQTSQAAQTAYQKQQTLVKNLAQKASDLQNLVKGTKTADEEAKEKAAAAQKRVNQLKDKLQDLNNQKQVEQNKLNAENAGLKSDQYQAGQINSDLASIQKNIANVKKEMAHAQEILNMEKDYIHATLSLSSDYIKAIKDFESQCDQLYKQVYDQDVAKGNGANAQADAFNTLNGNSQQMVNIKNNFYNAIKTAGYNLMTKLSGIPAYKFGGVWNKEDAAEKVDVNNLTDQQKKEINDYTFALLNNIRTQLGLKPLHHSSVVDQFANQVAQNYINDKHSIFNINAHDAKAVNDAADKYRLDFYHLEPKDYVSHEQKYEDIASWYADADLVILPDKNGTIKVMFYSGDQNDYHSSPSEIINGQTNMDSIKQGIFGNMLQMLLEDGLSDWGHTVSLLNLGAMKDYKSSNPQYYLGTSISKLNENPPESLKTLDLGGYTDHFLNVSSSDAKSAILQPDDDGATITAPTAAQIAAAKQTLATDTAKLQQYQQQQTQDQAKLEQINADISQRQGRINTIQSRIDSLSGQISQTNADLLKAEGIQSGADQDKNKNDSALQQQKDALQKATEDAQKNKTILDGLKNKADKAADDAQTAQNELNKLKNRSGQINSQIGTIKEALDYGGSTNQGQTGQNSGSGQNSQSGQASGNQQGQMGTNNTAASSSNTSAANANEQKSADPTGQQDEPDTSSDPDDSDAPDDSGDVLEDDNDNESAPASSSSRSWARNGNVHASQLRSMTYGQGARSARAASESGMMPLANGGHFDDSNEQGMLPQTGEDADTLAALAGAITVPLALIGLAGVRKKKRI